MSAGIYLITPSEFTLKEFLPRVEEALSVGVSVFQLRMKNENNTAFAENALEIKDLCKKYQVPFIINDRIHLYDKIKPDGLHVGIEDGAHDEKHIQNFREMIGKSGILGISCYNSKHAAMVAGENGADYVSFGQFFDTKTKPSRGKATPDIIKWWSTYTTIKSCAIGGIKPENCADIVKAGADFIAVVTGVWEHPKGISAAIQSYKQAIDSASAC